MSVLKMQHEQLQMMLAHAQAEQPNEACGLLAGLGANVTQVIPVANVAADPRHRFEMESGGLVRGLKHIDAAGLALVGIYHSHPVSDSIPSQYDIASARLNYPHIAHVIISLNHDRPRLQAWRIQPTEIETIELVVGGALTPGDEAALTHTQQYATLLAAVLAFAIMLSLSFALLPPAPMITPVAP